MKNITIPKYNLCEELINSISHGFGALLGIAGLVLLIIFSAKNGNGYTILASCIYGVSMIVMFTISCLYHAFGKNTKAKKVLRVLDHCDIYVFIAGTYTPFCICLINQNGLFLFITIWLCALIGVILNAISIEKFKIISFFLYLLMGWMIVFSFDSLNMVIAKTGIYLLFIGGIAYTVGAILYAIGEKKKYFHSIFHFFVLGGCILQFFSIFFYVI